MPYTEEANKFMAALYANADKSVSSAQAIMNMARAMNYADNESQEYKSDKSIKTLSWNSKLGVGLGIGAILEEDRIIVIEPGEASHPKYKDKSDAWGQPTYTVWIVDSMGRDINMNETDEQEFETIDEAKDYAETLASKYKSLKSTSNWDRIEREYPNIWDEVNQEAAFNAIGNESFTEYSTFTDAQDVVRKIKPILQTWVPNDLGIILTNNDVADWIHAAMLGDNSLEADYFRNAWENKLLGFRNTRKSIKDHNPNREPDPSLRHKWLDFQEQDQMGWFNIDNNDIVIIEKSLNEFVLIDQNNATELGIFPTLAKAQQNYKTKSIKSIPLDWQIEDMITKELISIYGNASRAHDLGFPYMNVDYPRLFKKIADKIVEDNNLPQARWVFAENLTKEHEAIAEAVHKALSKHPDYRENWPDSQRYETRSIKSDIPKGVMIALFVDPETAKSLLTPELAKIKGAELLSPEELHITLCYLGDQVPETKDFLLESLKGIRSNAETATIEGIGRFTETGNEMDALHLIVDVKDIGILRNTLVSTLEASGLEVSKEHTFKPHITLAYIPKSAEIPAINLPIKEIPLTNAILAWEEEKIPLKHHAVKHQKNEQLPVKSFESFLSNVTELAPNVNSGVLQKFYNEAQTKVAQYHGDAFAASQEMRRTGNWQGRLNISERIAGKLIDILYDDLIKETEYMPAKHTENIWLTIDEVKFLCPTCATKMKQRNLKSINLKGELAQEVKGRLENWARHMGNKYDNAPDFFGNCMTDPDILSYCNNDKKVMGALCAKMHFVLFGDWPSQATAKERYSSYATDTALELEANANASMRSLPNQLYVGQHVIYHGLDGDHEAVILNFTTKDGRNTVNVEITDPNVQEEEKYRWEYEENIEAKSWQPTDNGFADQELQAEVFEQDGGWYWKEPNGEPTGPFSSAEEAESNADVELRTIGIYRGPGKSMRPVGLRELESLKRTGALIANASTDVLQIVDASLNNRTRDVLDSIISIATQADIQQALAILGSDRFFSVLGDSAAGERWLGTGLKTQGAQ